MGSLTLILYLSPQRAAHHPSLSWDTGHLEHLGTWRLLYPVLHLQWFTQWCLSPFTNETLLCTLFQQLEEPRGFIPCGQNGFLHALLNTGPTSQNHTHHWCMYSVNALFLFYSDRLLSAASSNNSRSQIIMKNSLYARHSISTRSCAKMGKM